MTRSEKKERIYMSVAIVTGDAGLIGAETVRFFSKNGLYVVGIDNGIRREFFGEEASTAWTAKCAFFPQLMRESRKLRLAGGAR
jgi:NAD(P)-dependent dehydrogenase (short-subunit alcohol dehydrogenase family)